MEILLLPTVINFLDFTTLNRFPFLCKTTAGHVTRSCDGIGFWLSYSHSFSHHYGLFMRPDEGVLIKNVRKHFFDELWVAKEKWLFVNQSELSSSSSHAFKIKVSCRFRPGDRGHHNMCLPLHQFLKVRRDKNKLSENASDLLVGEEDPVEFLDSFLGSLMREPVLLLSSGKICERVIAVQCILRGGRDPFNGEKLTTEMMVFQADLSDRISAWRRKKETTDVSVGFGEVKLLIDEGAIDPELLDALMEAASLDHIAKRAQIDASNRFNSYPSEGDFRYDESNVAQLDLETVELTESTVQGLEDTNIDEDSERSLEVAQDRADRAHENSSDRFSSSKGTTARVIDINAQAGCLTMHIAGMGVRPFHFSNLYDGNASQSSVYYSSSSDSVAAALNGYNSCVLCYGQTGSGKTHTSFGPEGSLDQEICLFQPVPDSAGIVVRACVQLLEAKEALSKRGVYVSLSAQFVEIYDEKVTDLLSGDPVTVRRESGDLCGASEGDMNGGISDVLNLLRAGQARKRFAATAMNDRSSRSHTAFIVQIAQTRTIAVPVQRTNGASHTQGCTAPESLSATTAPPAPCSKLVRSQLHLVDLAGSERVKKSKATGIRLKEAVGINSSLLVLGKVIAALVESHRHVPYLESKLTTMLRGAFGGNSRTSAIINCRTDDMHGDETLQSIRFGERCGMISNITKLAATSLHTAIETIDSSLTRVAEQLQSLERRGKQHLESFQKLSSSYHLMLRKREDLARSSLEQKRY